MADASSDGTLVEPSGEWLPRVSEELHAVDWSTQPVVDIVTFEGATTRGFEDGLPRVEVHPQREPVPVETYANGERAFRVERVPREAWERLRA